MTNKLLKKDVETGNWPLKDKIKKVLTNPSCWYVLLYSIWWAVVSYPNIRSSCWCIRSILNQVMHQLWVRPLFIIWKVKREENCCLLPVPKVYLNWCCCPAIATKPRTRCIHLFFSEDRPCAYLVLIYCKLVHLSLLLSSF